jgi:ribose 5-phosphate isomerase B
MSLRIVVGSDDAGLQYKEILRRDLDDCVASIVDVGVSTDEHTAYPHIAVIAARMIAEGAADRALGVRHWSGRGNQRPQGVRHPRGHRE